MGILQKHGTLAAIRLPNQQIGPPERHRHPHGRPRRWLPCPLGDPRTVHGWTHVSLMLMECGKDSRAWMAGREDFFSAE